jgi:tRNA 2-thiouridine synthesizing protein A
MSGAMTVLATLPEPVLTLDASGLLCPIPIVRTAAAVRGLNVGEVLQVIATDPGIATDMPLWCRATRHEHLATVKDGPRFVCYVRKRGRAAEPG